MSAPGTILTNQILERHGARADGRLWRNPVAKAWVGKVVGRADSDGMMRVGKGDLVLRRATPIQTGLCIGAADLVGIHAGRFVGIEVKAGTDRLTAIQRRWLKVILDLGGIAGVAKSVEDVDKLLGAP